MNLEELIRNHVQLKAATKKGFHPILCKICNDHGLKGPRAAFKFENESILYRCFNCGFIASYKSTDKFISKKMKEVLNSFGIPEELYREIQFNNYINYNNNEDVYIPSKDFTPNIIQLPNNFYYLKDAKDDDKIAELARYYLEDRGIDPESYQFMLSDSKDVKWKHRIIFPMYKDNNLIFYIGRDMIGKAKKKYEAPSEDKSKVLFGFDNLFHKWDSPLFIVEGVFDAHVIDGVAIMGNDLSEGQIYWLNRSTKRKIYIPDKFGKGYIAAKKAIKQGWEISTPDFSSKIKDINDAVIKYGRLHTIYNILQHTHNGIGAEIALPLYCTDYEDD